MQVDEEVHVSSQPWSPERPETLVICCSDGRYHQHFEDFVRGRVSERPDLIALPGGPAAIDPWASSFDAGRVLDGSLELLLSSHELSSIWLIAHEGCGFYRKKHGEAAPEEIRRFQLRDLASAREKIAARWPAVAVHRIYARVEGDRVKFREIGTV